MSLALVAPGSARADRLYQPRFTIHDAKDADHVTFYARKEYIRDGKTFSGNALLWPWTIPIDSGDVLVTTPNYGEEIPSYPVRIGFSVHVGEIVPASPDDVVMANYWIGEPGRYAVTLNSGVMHVTMEVDIIASTEEGAQPTLLGIFECGGGNYDWTRETSWHKYTQDGIDPAVRWDHWDESYPGFVREWQSNSQNGLRLVDIDVFPMHWSWEPMFSGIYREGSGGYALAAGLEWLAFYLDVIQKAGQGLRLVDVESHEQGGKRLYIGVYRADSKAHTLHRGDWAEFTAIWADLSAQGQRLIDVETFVENGERLYLGIFIEGEGEGGYALTVGDWQSFHGSYVELTGAGLRLIDVETFVEGITRLYVGVFKTQAAPTRLVAGYDYQDFVGRYHAVSALGWRLMDLEVAFGVRDGVESGPDVGCVIHPGLIPTVVLEPPRDFSQFIKVPFPLFPPAGCSGIVEAKPEVVLKRTQTMAGGATLYVLSVKNAASFPDAMFQLARDLGPCGTIAQTSRTWVEMYDEHGNFRERLCSLLRAQSLEEFSFLVPKGLQAPSCVTVELFDRRCNHVYRSNCVRLAPSCASAAAPPEPVFTGTEELEGAMTTLYRIPVANFAAFPDELFDLSPDLAPCDLIPSASRTRVEVLDQDGDEIFSHCTFSAAVDLADLSFPLPLGATPPECVVVRLRDRLCGRVYESACVPLVLPEPEVRFRRGDCNDDGALDIADGICILAWRFQGKEPPGCLAVADTNGDGNGDLSDAVALLAWLFTGGTPPVPPFEACGTATLPTDSCATPPRACRG